ncbi:MAG: hypothetical protein NXY59_08255 [Aigarchaeota archaeon]|nr:hypothetical protein [Candidatus Pelearchaeum maunauluense]
MVSLLSEVDLFRRLSESGDRDKAIIATFGAVMGRLMGEGYRSKTYLELLEENPARLDKESIASLKRMYGIYEMVRFGEVQPDEGMLNFFGDELLKLKAHLTTLKGVRIGA